jgi:hypothetical protein
METVNLSYQRLKYAVDTTYRAGSNVASNFDNAGPVGDQYPAATRNVTNGQWGITGTVLGQKSRLIGVTLSYSRRCDFNFTVPEDRTEIPVSRFTSCRAWEENVDWDYIDLAYGGTNQSRVISSLWNNQGISGFGWCPESSKKLSAGPLKPGPSSSYASAEFMSATDELGTPFTAAQYKEEGPVEPTRWGTARAAGNFPVFLLECYYNPLPLNDGVSKTLFSPGRYIASVEMDSTEARVFTIGSGRTNAQLARAYLPPAGTYVYQVGSISNALTNSNAGRITTTAAFGLAQMKKSTVATVISCKDRGSTAWRSDPWEPAANTDMAYAWNNANWPDNGRISYYDSNVTCPTPFDPANPFAFAGGDISAGVVGSCEYVQGSPTVLIDGVAYPVQAGKSVEVRANNVVRPLVFGQSHVNIIDAAGSGRDETRTVRPLQRSQLFAFGGVDRRNAPLLGNTVSPSFSWPIQTGNIDVNKADEQPYSSQTLFSLNAEQSARGNWERFDAYSTPSTDPFKIGLGLGFDESSTVGNSFVVQDQRRTTGVFRMLASTFGLDGTRITFGGGGANTNLTFETPESDPRTSRTFLTIPITQTTTSSYGVTGSYWQSSGYNQSVSVPQFRNRGADFINGQWIGRPCNAGESDAGHNCVSYSQGWQWVNTSRQVTTYGTVTSTVDNPTPSGFRIVGRNWVSNTPVLIAGVTVQTFTCTSRPGSLRAIEINRGSLG